MKNIDSKNELTSISRSHEQCDECSLVNVEPPVCKGHQPGEVSCPDFKRQQRFKYEVIKEEYQIGPLVCKIIFEDCSAILLRNYGYHSPDGFQIGYSGSGPADLAYSILYDYFFRTTKNKDIAKSKAQNLHQFFKEDFVAKSHYILSVEDYDIIDWLEEKDEL